MLLLRMHFWSAVHAIVKYHNTTALLVAVLLLLSSIKYLAILIFIIAKS